MSTCKITVIKRTLNSDLAAEYVEMEVGPCEVFHRGPGIHRNSPG